MKYEGCLLSVSNMDVAKGFYQGVLEQEIQMDLGVHVSFATFSLQENYADLIGIAPDSIKRQSHNFQLYFEVEDLETWIKKLKEKNIQFVHDKKEYEWGQNVIRIYDPDMNIVEVAESMVTVVKRYLNLGMTVEETAKKTMYPIEFIKECENSNI